MHSREVQRTQVQRGLELMVNTGVTPEEASIRVRGDKSLTWTLRRGRRDLALSQALSQPHSSKICTIILSEGYELCDVCGESLGNGDVATRLTLVHGYCKYAHPGCIGTDMPLSWKKYLALRPSTPTAMHLSSVEVAQHDEQYFDHETDPEDTPDW